MKKTNNALEFLTRKGIIFDSAIPEFNDNAETFFQKLGIKNILFEISDTPKSFYSWIKANYDRGIQDLLSEFYEGENVVTNYRIIAIKNIEKTFMSREFIKVFQSKDLERLLANTIFRSNNKAYTNFYFILNYFEKKIIDKKTHYVKSGTIHIAPNTVIQSPSNIASMIAKHEETGKKVGSTEKKLFLEALAQKTNVRDEFEKVLFLLHQFFILHEKGLHDMLAEKGLYLKEISTEIATTTKVKNPKTNEVEVIHGKEDGIEYIMFTLIFKDKQKHTAYAQLIKELTNSPNSSYSRSSTGEKKALAKLEQISIATSDFASVVDFLTKKLGKRSLVNTEFDSSFKFSFILAENFNLHPSKYSEELILYYKNELGNKIKEELGNIFIKDFLKENEKLTEKLEKELKAELKENFTEKILKDRVEEALSEQEEFDKYTPSKLVGREWEDREVPLKKMRVLMLTIPKFVIAEFVNYAKVKDQVGGFITPLTSIEVDLRIRLENMMLTSPYGIELGTKKRRNLEPMFNAFRQCITEIRLLTGNKTIQLNTLLRKASSDNKLEETYHKNVRTKRTINNNIKKQEKRDQAISLFKKQQYEIIDAMPEQERSLVFGENWTPAIIESKIMENVAIEYPLEDEAKINSSLSELQMVINLIRGHLLKYIEDINELDPRYTINSKGAGFEGLEITRNIKKKQDSK